MAKLYAHGHEVGTIHFLTSAKRYMSDGVVLKNTGFGWKIAGKVKPGITPEQAFNSVSERVRAYRAERPAYSAYRAELHNLAGLSKRWKLHQCIGLMPDDADGVWSECCDGYGDNIHADINEVSRLCELYKASLREQQAQQAHA